MAKKKATDDLFAIKVLKKSDLIGKNMTSHVLTERRVLSLAQAPFVVTLYYAFESEEHLFLVMEYLIGGDLSSVLQEQGRLREDAARFYIAEVTLALEYLHDHGIIHRDLKPDNMLLDGEGHLKLTDFGLADYGNLAGRVGYDEGKGKVLGTPEYMAPELLNGGAHGTAVDWWAVGVCLFELVIGVPPFTGDSPTEIFEKVLHFERINWQEYPELSLTEDLRDLVDKLLCPDPSTRLGSQGTKCHPFFANLDWDALRQCIAPIRPTPCDSLDTSGFNARNRRYDGLGLPDDFLTAEPVGESILDDSASGISTPSKLIRRTSSPFDGFLYKNIDLLSRVNRKLSTTPSSFLNDSRASSGGALSDSFLDK